MNLIAKILLLFVAVIVIILAYNIYNSKAPESLESLKSLEIYKKESFATVNDFTQTGLLAFYNSNYASGCPVNANGNNKIECFVIEVLTQYMMNKSLVAKGSTSYFVKSDVLALIIALLNIIKGIKDTNGLTSDNTVNLKPYNYNHITGYLNNANNSITNVLTTFTDSTDTSGSTLYIPRFSDNMMVFFYNKQCDPNTGEIAGAIKMSQNSVTDLSAKIATNVDFYTKVCINGQHSCEEYDTLPEVVKCRRDNGMTAPQCDELRPTCIVPPSDVRLMSCPNIASLITSTQTINMANKRNLANAQCDSCNYCDHPGDVSLCESVCNQTITANAPLPISTSSPSTATTTSSAAPAASTTTRPASSTQSSTEYTESAASTITRPASSSQSVPLSASSQPTIFPPYSFTLDSTTMESTHLFDNVDVFTSYSSLFNPELTSLGDIYNVTNNSASTNVMANTYDNTVDVKTLINNISLQLQQQIANQIQSNLQQNQLASVSINPGIPNSSTSVASSTTGSNAAGHGVGNEIVQERIDGVSNVFAPNIVINPVIPQSAFDYMALQQ